MKVTLTVNDIVYEREVEPRLLLSDFLRVELGLTGTHVGCEHGVCGACTILFDDRAGAFVHHVRGPGRRSSRAHRGGLVWI